jgi:hypothetical protein
MAVAVVAMVVVEAVRGIIIRLEESGVLERFVSSGPAQPVYSHQQIQEICNAYSFWKLDSHPADASKGCKYMARTSRCAYDWHGYSGNI